MATTGDGRTDRLRLGARVRRILFVAEAVTLAQIVRLVTLARALDPARYEIHFAAALFDDLIFDDTAFHRHAIYSLPAHTIDARVASGRRLYGQRTLARYVRDDRALFADVRPDLVVGDLRLSLPVSAAVDKIPYASLINAYWSPHVLRSEFPLPDHPIVKLLGVKLAARYFQRALPRVFAHFANPVNALRRQHGLQPLGSLQQVLTHGDHTLFPDVPQLIPTQNLPPHQMYLGPVLWSPPVALPPWWGTLDPKRPTIYVTLGSSGRVQRLPMVIDVAAKLGFQILVATAGRSALPTALPQHVYVADYLPGDQAARRSIAVVSNGGSTTGYQALSQGRPVLGIAFNLDQYLAMTAIQDAGAGILLRAGALNATQVRQGLVQLTSEASFMNQAIHLRDEFSNWNAAARFAAFVDQSVGA
jgi:UDP:flavonoid glycosyltransferase YjiC (YdhE family)